MDPDLALTISVVLAAFVLPALMRDYSENFRPYTAIVLAALALSMALLAIAYKPGGYVFSDIPDVIIRVLARYLM